MENSIYQINKGINRSIEFKGLRAQYIWYVGAMVLLLMGAFALLYWIGFNEIICIAITGGSGAFGFTRIYALSNKYGEYGLMKKMANRRVPHVLRCECRKMFEFKKTVAGHGDENIPG